jgi:hypothetical protein
MYINTSGWLTFKKINFYFVILDISEPNVNTFLVHMSINDKSNFVSFPYTYTTEINGNAT